MKLEDCYGRLFTQDQLEVELLGEAQELPAMVEEKTACFVIGVGPRLIRLDGNYR